MWNGNGIREASRPVLSRLLDLLFPRTCVHCGRLAHGPGEVFSCRSCRTRYRIIEDPVCDRCGAPVYGAVRNPPGCAKCQELGEGFSRARSLFHYSGAGACLVHELKYGQGIHLQREITVLLQERLEWEAYFRGSTLVPIPLHPRRYRERGYNQAEIVCRAIVAAFGDIRIDNCLARIRSTGSQTFLSRDNRFRNMRGAFRCKSRLPEGHLVLVDDVLTTGATLTAAARALAGSGGENISAFTLAHG